MKSPLEVLQPLGRALMLPIAVLPVAALLLRIGQPDLLGAPGLAAGRALRHCGQRAEPRRRVGQCAGRDGLRFGVDCAAAADADEVAGDREHADGV